MFRRDVEIAGTAFLGAAWRDQGRAWLAVDRRGPPRRSGPVLRPRSRARRRRRRRARCRASRSTSQPTSDAAGRRRLEGVVGRRCGGARAAGDGDLRRRQRARRARGAGLADRRRRPPLVSRRPPAPTDAGCQPASIRRARRRADRRPRHRRRCPQPTATAAPNTMPITIAPSRRRVARLRAPSHQPTPTPHLSARRPPQRAGVRL